MTRVGAGPAEQHLAGQPKTPILRLRPEPPARDRAGCQAHGSQPCISLGIASLFLGEKSGSMDFSWRKLCLRGLQRVGTP